MIDKIIIAVLLLQGLMLFEKKDHKPTDSELVDKCHPLVEGVIHNTGLGYVLYPCKYVDLYCKDECSSLLDTREYKKLFDVYSTMLMNITRLCGKGSGTASHDLNESISLDAVPFGELNSVIKPVYALSSYQRARSLRVVSREQKELRAYRAYYEEQCKQRKKNLDKNNQQHQRRSKHGVQY